MKYIRTKDRCLYSEEDWKDYGLCHYENKNEHFTIVNQADTIEKLCDEFVFKYKSEDLPRNQRLDELIKCLSEAEHTFKDWVKWLFRTSHNNLEFVKLAIWTEKGLKYVAEMNEEGEPKLL